MYQSVLRIRVSNLYSVLWQIYKYKKKQRKNQIIPVRLHVKQDLLTHVAKEIAKP